MSELIIPKCFAIQVECQIQYETLNLFHNVAFHSHDFVNLENETLYYANIAVSHSSIGLSMGSQLAAQKAQQTTHQYNSCEKDCQSVWQGRYNVSSGYDWALRPPTSWAKK